MRNILHIILISLAFSFIGCDDQPDTPTLTLPTNVSMEIEKSDNVEGNVAVQASAIKQNYFTIIFEDGDNTESFEVTDGKASHTYSATGIYDIIVRAHASGNDYTEITDTVHIYIQPGVNQNGVPTTGYSTPMSYTGYNLVWNDEFDGTQLNTSDWNYQIGTGNGGWGNNELQYYRQENTSVSDGYLTITAKKENINSSNYSSSRLTTQNKKSFKYGRIDIRAALPKGQGLWPALWMLGESHATIGWPECGEIDIMEIVGGSQSGKSDRTVYGTLHWDNFGQYATYGGNTLTSQDNFSDEFHVFSIIWDANSIKWMLDDKQFHDTDITPSHMAEFREKFFFIFNVAVGGNWPGSPDATTVFPQKMHVDYIRVFQKP